MTKLSEAVASLAAREREDGIPPRPEPDVFKICWDGMVEPVGWRTSARLLGPVGKPNFDVMYPIFGEDRDRFGELLEPDEVAEDAAREESDPP